MDDSLIINKNSDEYDDWIVVKGPAGGFIGKPIYDETCNSSGKRKEILDKVSQGDVIGLNPVYEFVCPIRPVQMRDGSMAFSRDSVVVTPDFILHGLTLWVKVAGVYFFSDMQPEDKERYKSSVKQAKDNAIKARAASHGLSIIEGGKGRRD